MKLISLMLLFALSVLMCNAQETKPGPQPPPETGEKFKVGMAGYTFVKFDLDKTLETLKKAERRMFIIYASRIFICHLKAPMRKLQLFMPN